MKLDHLNLDQLKLSPLNVRSRGGKNIADLLPLIRRNGIIQPLLVRPNCEGFEIIAGQRRYHTLIALKEEGIAEPVPCIIMEEGDDAKAIEASLAENIGHLPMDEIDQYKAFSALNAKGMDVSDIAAHFAVTERLVQQRLAIANLIDPILNAYRREEIGADTLRILTMATPRQQKAWWKLFKSEEDYAPTGRMLKDWLFGGSQIPVGNALFDLALYDKAIASDLFGDERFFTDSETFWPLQNAAIAERRESYLAEGWSEVVILDIGQRFATWEHEKTPKKKGGKVFVTITHDGEATFHEGWLSMKEARRREKAASKGVCGNNGGNTPVKAGRLELTNAMQNYLGLHKHAAVRTELLVHPGIALRLSVAHIIGGSSLWSVTADEQRADGKAIAESLSRAKATEGFEQERDIIRKLLGIEPDDGETIVPRRSGETFRSLAGLFGSLMHMEEHTVLRVLAFVMAETLAVHSGTVEALGILFKTDMRQWWTPDETFFDLLRDKQAINAILREVAGDVTADAHVASTAKVQKKIVADCLAGNGRAKVDNWLPRYMAFPASGYTGRLAAHPSVIEADEKEDEGDIEIIDQDKPDRVVSEGHDTEDPE